MKKYENLSREELLEVFKNSSEDERVEIRKFVLDILNNGKKDMEEEWNLFVDEMRNLEICEYSFQDLNIG